MAVPMISEETTECECEVVEIRPPLSTYLQ